MRSTLKQKKREHKTEKSPKKIIDRPSNGQISVPKKIDKTTILPIYSFKKNLVKINSQQGFTISNKAYNTKVFPLYSLFFTLCSLLYILFTQLLITSLNKLRQVFSFQQILR